MQKSLCYKCGKTVDALGTSEGRAIFRCSCGRKWTTRAYYGKTEYRTSDKAVFTGAALGLLLGGPVGALVGGAIGGFVGSTEITSECLNCGGIGRPTGHRGRKTMFQCEKCLRTWVEQSETPNHS